MKLAPPNQFRLTASVARRLKLPIQLASDDVIGMNGMFLVPHNGVMLRCMISDGACVEDDTGQWEHVSVSTVNRCPTWAEMCFAKDLFFNDDECVIQYHPPKENYVNNHPYCLHLWKPRTATIPTPPSILVGLKGVTLRP